jgi:hypothetical protein
MGRFGAGIAFRGCPTSISQRWPGCPWGGLSATWPPCGAFVAGAAVVVVAGAEEAAALFLSASEQATKPRSAADNKRVDVSFIQDVWE